jgi:hypothetical protein
LAVLVDPESFGGIESAESLRSRLRNGRVPHVVVRNGDDIGKALAAGAS